MNHTTLRIVVVALVACVVTIHGQAPSAGRVTGTVRLEDSTVVAGVTVELIPTGGSTYRTAVTDVNGRYVFEDVRNGTTHWLMFTLPGFQTEKREGIAVRPGETATIDVTLKVSCLVLVDFVHEPILYSFLASDVVLYLRITEGAAEQKTRDQRYCDGKRAPAVILDVVHASRPEWRPNTVIQLDSVNVQLRPGDEYLVFMDYSESLQRFLFDGRMFTPVRNGRVEWGNDGLFGVRDGMPIQTALQQLRETYQRNKR